MRLILALFLTALLALAALSAKGAPADEATLDLRPSIGNPRPDRPMDAPAFPNGGVDDGRIEHGTFGPDYRSKKVVWNSGDIPDRGLGPHRPLNTMNMRRVLIRGKRPWPESRSHPATNSIVARLPMCRDG